MKGVKVREREGSFMTLPCIITQHLTLCILMWLAINFLRTASVILISLIIYRERIIAVDRIENDFTHFARFIVALASAAYLRMQMRISVPFPVYRFHLVLPESIVLRVARRYRQVYDFSILIPEVRK